MPNWFARPRSSSLRNDSRRRRVPQLECLEDRLAPATLTVTTTADDLTPNDGTVSLREAITAINAGNDLGDPNVTAQNPGTFGTNDTINFNVPGSGVQTVSPASALPTIVKPVTIDGYSQPGASPNGAFPVLLIELNGTNAGAGVNGLVLGAGSGGSTIKGLVINRFQADTGFVGGNGILVQSNGNTIAGNFVGVEPEGGSQRPNGGDGIRVAASNNVIGGTGPGDRNVVAGNMLDGIHILGTVATPATGNLIRNNYVGVGTRTNSVGTRTVAIPGAAAVGTASGNFLNGIEISGGDNNTVSSNLVGFNTEGIAIDNGGQHNVIQANEDGIFNDSIGIGNFARHRLAQRPRCSLRTGAGQRAGRVLQPHRRHRTGDRQRRQAQPPRRYRHLRQPGVRLRPAEHRQRHRGQFDLPERPQQPRLPAGHRPEQPVPVSPGRRPCAGASLWERTMLSARNQLKGTVKSVKLGEVMAEVVVAVGQIEVVSVITRTSAEQMGLRPGDEVTAVIKSTEVILAKG
jgi:molybdopterin-binding protein